MLMSMFSSFDAFTAESLGQKIGFSRSTPTSENGKAVDASKGAPATPTNESVKKGKVGNSTEDGSSSNNRTTCHGRNQKVPLMRPRFAPELDGVFCFETIVPY